MFGRLFVSARTRGAPAPAEQDQDRAAAMLAEIAGDFPAMRPVRPPQARNDDLGAQVYAQVEQGLREAGYLRAG